MTQRPARSTRPFVALLVLATLASCLSGASPTPSPSVTVSNISSAVCTHQQAGGVVCTVNLDVQLHNANIFDTLVTLATNDTLSQQWLIGVIGQDINYGFAGSKLTRSDTGCLAPQSTISVYDGPSAEYPLIATATINPIALTCN